MTSGSADERDVFVRNSLEATVKIGAILIILVWCFRIIEPFVGIVVWGTIIAVAVYPLAQKLAVWIGGRYKTAAAILTVLMLLLLVTPAIELAAIVVDNVNALSARVETGSGLRIPMPPESVTTWPLVGETVADFWTLAATNLTEALKVIEPQLKAIGTWLITSLAGVGLGVLQFVAAIIIAGVFMANASGSGEFARALGRRLAGDRGDELTRLAEATVRGVARGVIGVAFIQSTLAGIGLVVADIPGRRHLDPAVPAAGNHPARRRAGHDRRNHLHVLDGRHDAGRHLHDLRESRVRQRQLAETVADGPGPGTCRCS